MSRPVDVVIVGAGLAGLCCGRRLAECGTSFQIVEAADAVGGRVRTDVVDGFCLDRGFQVLLTAAPEVRRVLDLEALDLRSFFRKTMVWLVDFWYQSPIPSRGWASTLLDAFGPFGSIREQFRASRFVSEVARDSFEAIETRDDRPAIDLLRHAGLSPKIIDRFFRPFLSCFSLERDLATSSQYLRFVLKALVEGEMVVPARGIQAIPDQIHTKLPANSVRLNSQVERLEPGTAILASGERVEARTVVVATDGTKASRLIDGVIHAPEYRGMTTLYYVAEKPAVVKPILWLIGEGPGPLNHLALLPMKEHPGRTLIAANILGLAVEDDARLDGSVRDQLRQWFNRDVDGWKLLRVYRIPNALPDMSVGKLDPWRRPVRIRPGLYVCGDHRDQGGINGAMESGFRAAQAVMEDLHQKLV